MTVKACLGGMCKLRSQCEHHENPDNRETDDDPAERLCDRGFEREMFFLRAENECVQRGKTLAVSTALRT